MKSVMRTAAGLLALTALAAAAPAASALPTGSFGSGERREVVIIDGTLEISDLDNCWASGFPRDIRFENQSSRTYLVFDNKDCSGDPVASVAGGTTATHYGWSAVAAR
ncbi:hypothetical protein [Nocardia huaxiensis]|uniref:Uncharacterized protein n=1 Tax=Nocardia huaxiensis TaxID=2755382 RepID=A0A7D6ZJL2_9NOCA|nr:hypothetical protein [Nocardia huaxiensis]QLY32619.1 hypothetical protein H0264_10495 [Nocardia huaxiensis]UFS93652.1 hypothetical protein LPY97_22880 [Nocardia huaxiensis]